MRPIPMEALLQAFLDARIAEPGLALASWAQSVPWLVANRNMLSDLARRVVAHDRAFGATVVPANLSQAHATTGDPEPQRHDSMSHQDACPKMSSMLVTDDYVLFWRPPAPFSQWTRSIFQVDRTVYSSAEQFMMAEKARLFGDHEICARILATDSPRRQKALGQQVRGFDAQAWFLNRERIVERGNLAKFGQDEALKRMLLATGHRTLVEASPMDCIWGIGLAPEDPRALDPKSWRGQNLLGVVLERVRRQLGEVAA